MQGVTIISETSNSSPPILLVILLCISALGVIIASATILGTLWEYGTFHCKAFAVFLSACMLLIGAGLWAGTLTKDNQNGIQYTVQVDDTVNFNEFMSKYEIIKQNGDTYIIRERSVK